MAKISVNFNGIADANKTLQKAIREISQTEDRLAALKAGVDPNVLSLFEIYGKLTACQNEAEDIRYMADKLLAVSEAGVQKYREIESELCKLAQAEEN